MKTATENDFRNDMEMRGFDLPETQELFRCILRIAMKRALSEEQVDWLLSKRRRAERFWEAVR